jgi:spore photoproduct lyase
MTEKFNKAIQNSFFTHLPKRERFFIKEKSLELKFSYQEIKQIIEMARDLEM